MLVLFHNASVSELCCKHIKWRKAYGHLTIASYFRFSPSLLLTIILESLSNIGICSFSHKGNCDVRLWCHPGRTWLEFLSAQATQDFSLEVWQTLVYEPFSFLLQFSLIQSIKVSLKSGLLRGLKFDIFYIDSKTVHMITRKKSLWCFQERERVCDFLKRWCLMFHWKKTMLRGSEIELVRIQMKQWGIYDATGEKRVCIMFQGRKGCLQSFRGAEGYM